MKQYVVMVAGGTGTRMRQTTAKQVLNVEGLPLMWWTLRRFRRGSSEAESPSCFTKVSSRNLRNSNELGSAGARHVVPGGAERFHSVLAGLNTLPVAGIVGIHDAVRPFPSVETIQRCFKVAAEKGQCGARGAGEGQHSAGD